MTRRDKAIIKEHKPYLAIDESKWTTEIDENGRKIFKMPPGMRV